MRKGIRVLYQGVTSSPELASKIAQHASALASSPAAIVDWQIALQRWHRHHGQGAYYRVALEVMLAHKAIKVSRESELDAPREALAALVDETFASVERSLRLLASDADAGRHLIAHSAEERRLHALHGSL